MAWRLFGAKPLPKLMLILFSNAHKRCKAKWSKRLDWHHNSISVILVVGRGKHISPPGLGTNSAKNKGKWQKSRFVNWQGAHTLCYTPTYYPIYHTQLQTVSLCSFYMTFHCKMRDFCHFHFCSSQFLYPALVIKHMFLFLAPELLAKLTQPIQHEE